MDYSCHLDDLLVIRDFFENNDIQTKNTRIERYIVYLQNVISQGLIDASIVFKNSTGEPFNDPLDWALYVLREIHELMWIMKGLEKHRPTGINQKLKTIVGGRDFAALDADPLSRNIQFELRIASYFCQAGCEVDLSTSTDIIARTEEYLFYLECKRAGSLTQLNKRLIEAKKQLKRRIPKSGRKRNVLSCIASDVTRIAFSHNGITLGMTNEHSRDVIQEKLIGISKSTDSLPLFDGIPSLFNNWFQIHIPALIIHPPTVTTRFSSLHTFKQTPNRKMKRGINKFKELFESSSKKKDKRETPARELKLRTAYQFPEGTTFRFDDGVLNEYIMNGKINNRDYDYEVGAITIKGKTYRFHFYDLQLALPMVTRESPKELLKDPNQIRFLMVMFMYVQRFPYEDS